MKAKAVIPGILLLAGMSVVSAHPESWNNMMGNWMMPGYGGMWAGWIIGWIIGILFVIGLVLAIIWLVRQLEKDSRRNERNRR